jgi:hypothetical protein
VGGNADRPRSDLKKSISVALHKRQVYFTEAAKDGVMLAAREKKEMAREARIIMNVV